MKIHIKADGHNIRLWLPTSLLKSRIGYNIIEKAIQQNVEKKQNEKQNTLAETDQNLVATAPGGNVEQAKHEVPITREQVKEMYATLRRVIKECGHFNLVEVENAKGEKVLIRL